MPSKRDVKPAPPFLLNEVDRQGRRIAPEVLTVAREIGPRALSYAEKPLGDSAIATSYLEEAAARKDRRALGQPSRYTGCCWPRDICTGSYLAGRCG